MTTSERWLTIHSGYKCAAKKLINLYDITAVINLQDALKRQLYNTSYRDEGLVDCEGISDDIDSLQYWCNG